MKINPLFTLLITLFVTVIYAQDTSEDVLFTVAEEPIYVSEFLRVYNKNLDLVQDESQKNVDEYLSLFTNYKLKLKEAKIIEIIRYIFIVVYLLFISLPSPSNSSFMKPWFWSLDS